MKLIHLLFFGISLGTLTTLSVAGVNYELKYAELILLIMLPIIIFAYWYRGHELKLNTFDKALYVLWYGVLFYSVLIYFWSDKSITALSGSLVLAFGIAAYFLGNFIIYRNPKVFVTANRILIVSLFIQLAINMLPVLTGPGMSFYAMKENSNTLLGNSNLISFYFSFALIYEFIAKDRRWLLFSLISLGGVILTISRGAVVAIIVSLLVYLGISMFNKNIKKRTVFFGMSLLAVGFIIFVRYTIPGMELWYGMQQGLQASSVSSRQLIWGQAISDIKSNILGNGVVWEDDPHNIVLRAIRDLGVVFGPVFLFLVGYPVLYFLNPRILSFSKQGIAILIAYLSVFIHAMIEVFYLTSISLIWTVLILTFLNAIIRKEYKKMQTSQ